MVSVGIVGGGIAGLTAGYELLSRGIKNVQIWEKEPGKEIVCAGGISVRGAEKLGLKIPGRFIESRVGRLRIHSPSNSTWEITGDLAHVIDRNNFQKDLTRRIEKMGGEFIWRRVDKIEGLLDRYDFVIGADGTFGPCSRLMGPIQKQDLAIAVQTCGRIKDHPRDRIELYLGVPGGYAWVFPASGHQRIGLGSVLSHRIDVRNSLNLLINNLGASECSGFKLKPIPLCRPRNNLVFKNMVLIGDSGRLTDPSTGGGILNSIESARASARAILDGKLKNYNKYIGGIRQRNKFRYRIKTILLRMENGDIERMVMSLKRLNPTRGDILSVIRLLIIFAVSNPDLVIKNKIFLTLAGLTR